MKKCIAAYLLILCFVLYTCGEAVASSIEIGGSLSASENESTLQTEVSEDAFIGMWTLSTISVDGFSMPAAYAGISLTLNIKYGKTEMESTVDGEFTHTEVESYLSGEKLILNLENGNILGLNVEADGRLLAQDDDMFVYFEKITEGETVENNVPGSAPKRSKVDEAEFWGEWSASYVKSDGIITPILLYGSTFYLTIQEGTAMMEIRYDNKVDLIEAKTVMSSDVLIVDNDGEIFAICLYEDGTVSFELNGVEIYFERVSNYVTGNQIVNSELKLSDYTYDEFIMYYTMTLGYGAILDALKNPKTAEILGISYNPENKMAYFCVLAENDFGGNTKSYISFGYNRRSITESDNLKDDYDSSSIHRTMDDLMLFMKAAENADESEMPTDDIDSKLAMYSENDKKMFALFAEGGDYVDNWYDNVFVIGYKYDSSTETAYFYFMGDDIDGIASTYARYNEEFGFDAHDAFEQQYNSADITIYQYEIDNYMESIAPKITK